MLLLLKKSVTVSGRVRVINPAAVACTERAYSISEEQVRVTAFEKRHTGGTSIAAAFLETAGGAIKQ
jgi:hypothetical protein